jgi:hypothetical protein
MQEPFNFPEALPSLPPDQTWSANTITARQVLNNAYIRALQTLREEDSDPLRYKLLPSNIVDNLVPILEGMEAEVPWVWIDECTNILGPLVYELQVSALAAEGMQVCPTLNSIHGSDPLIQESAMK